MNPNFGVSNGPLDLQRRCWRGGQRDLRVDGVYLRRRGTNERERNSVLSWIAALQMRHSIIGMDRHSGVFMGRQPVVVLRVIVIAVGVRVQ